MNLFELNWREYDDWCSFLFTHEKKTEEEFKKDCQTLLRKYGNEFIDSQDSWIGADRWICHLATKLPELGYVGATPIRADFDGSEILDEDEDNSDFRKVVGEELFKKACAKNLEIEKGLREYKSEGFAIPNNHLPVQKTPEKP